MKEKIVGLYPLTKFSMVISAVIIGIVMRNIWGLIIWFAVLNILALITGVYKKFFKAVYGGVGILALLMLIMQGLFYPGEKILLSIGIFSFKAEGLLYAVRLSLILFIVAGAFIWYFQVTTHKEFVYSLENAGLSSKVTFVILSTLQMIPVLQKKSNTIMNAQRARGVETEGNLLTRIKVFLPTLGPLVLSSIANTEERALTLEARGFSAPVKKTHLYVIEKKKSDKKVEIGIWIFTILFIIGRVIVWRL